MMEWKARSCYQEKGSENDSEAKEYWLKAYFYLKVWEENNLISWFWLLYSKNYSKNELT